MRSVVIRMNIDEMPTACGPCELSCTAICKEWTKVDRKEIGRTKSPNCPILAILPEGHGRLVDADELYMKIKGHDTTRPLLERRKGVIEEKHICLHDICKQPTIVPAERQVDASDAVAPTDTPTVPAERSET